MTLQPFQRELLYSCKVCRFRFPFSVSSLHDLTHYKYSLKRGQITAGATPRKHFIMNMPTHRCALMCLTLKGGKN